MGRIGSRGDHLLLFTDDTASVVDSERLNNLMRKFGGVHERGKLKVNVEGKVDGEGW